METSQSLPVSGGVYNEAREGLFIRDCSDRTRGNGYKLKEGKFNLDIWKKDFPVRVLWPWHRLSRAVVTPSLEVSKAGLEWVWSNLV